MTDATKKKRDQKTVWVPTRLREWVHVTYEENKDDLKKVNVHSESQFYAYLIEQGATEVLRVLKTLKKLHT